MPRLSPAAPSSVRRRIAKALSSSRTVAPLRIADAQDAHAHAETQILGVAEPRLDRPPFGVEVDDLGHARGRIAGGQMPSLLHPLGVDADRRADLVAGGGEFGAAQETRPPCLADPVGGQARLAIRRGHMNVAAKADDVTEAEAFEEFEQFDVESPPCLPCGRRLYKQQGSFAPRALPRLTATTNPSVTLSPSIDFPVEPVIRSTAARVVIDKQARAVVVVFAAEEYEGQATRKTPEKWNASAENAGVESHE